jgi:hypothetical protein
MPSPPHKPTAATRLRAAAVAGLLLLGNGATWFHGATVLHSVCPEHGEVVHAEATGPDGAPGAPSGVAEPTHVSVAATPLGAGAHPHDHCAATAVTRERTALLEGGSALALAAPGAAVPAGAGERPVQRARDVFAYAPKTSPPEPTVPSRSRGPRRSGGGGQPLLVFG